MAQGGRYRPRQSILLESSVESCRKGTEDILHLATPGPCLDTGAYRTGREVYLAEAYYPAGRTCLVPGAVGLETGSTLQLGGFPGVVWSSAPALPKDM